MYCKDKTEMLNIIVLLVSFIRIFQISFYFWVQHIISMFTITVINTIPCFVDENIVAVGNCSSSAS